ncbi:MAG: hypothetical protein Q8J96_06620 [Rhodocyclaceae bacterium]|nr:hypothetical protein [Rhodocyclaceae bacterium]
MADFALHLRIAHQIAGRVGLELDVTALDEPALRGVHDIQFNLLARFGNPVGALPHTVVLDTRRVPCASRSSDRRCLARPGHAGLRGRAYRMTNDNHMKDTNDEPYA